MGILIDKGKPPSFKYNFKLALNSGKVSVKLSKFPNLSSSNVSKHHYVLKNKFHHLIYLDFLKYKNSHQFFYLQSL